MKKSNQFANDSDQLGQPDDWPELRENFFSPQAEVDEELCQSIMRAVVEIDHSEPIRVASRLRIPLLVGAAAAMIAVFAVFWRDSPPAPEGPTIVESSVSPVPEKEEDAFQAFADTLSQQALLQRDVRKLSTHLRKNVILFQPGVAE